MMSRMKKEKYTSFSQQTMKRAEWNHTQLTLSLLFMFLHESWKKESRGLHTKWEDDEWGSREKKKNRDVGVKCLEQGKNNCTIQYLYIIEVLFLLQKQMRLQCLLLHQHDIDFIGEILLFAQ